LKQPMVITAAKAAPVMKYDLCIKCNDA
jgi:hypothetical protein